MGLNRQNKTRESNSAEQYELTVNLSTGVLNMPVRETEDTSRQKEDKRSFSQGREALARDIDDLINSSHSKLLPLLRLEEMINWLVVLGVLISAPVLFNRSEAEVKSGSSDVWWGKVAAIFLVIFCTCRALSKRRAIADIKQNHIELKRTFESNYGRNPLWHDVPSASSGSQSSMSADSKTTTFQPKRG